MDLNELNASKMGMFKNAVNRQADREIEELTAKIREQRSAANFLRDEKEAHEALSKLRAERSAAESGFKKEFSRCDFESGKRVLAHRKKLITSFFEDVENELRAFAAGKDYEDYLKRRLEKAESALGKGCVILASPKDKEKVSALTENEVRADRAITLGGICALDEKRGLFVDLTLDKALEDEKADFCGKSELRS